MIINEILQWMVLIWIVWSLTQILPAISIMIDSIDPTCKLKNKKKEDERN